MEKVVAILREPGSSEHWCTQLRGQVADEILDMTLTRLALPARLAAYVVTESVPLPLPDESHRRTAGLAKVALPPRPGDLDEATWRARWQLDTSVAVETQATFGANVNIDTVPTSRYVLRSPFAL